MSHASDVFKKKFELEHEVSKLTQYVKDYEAAAKVSFARQMFYFYAIVKAIDIARGTGDRSPSCYNIEEFLEGVLADRDVPPEIEALKMLHRIHRIMSDNESYRYGVVELNPEKSLHNLVEELFAKLKPKPCQPVGSISSTGAKQSPANAGD